MSIGFSNNCYFLKSWFLIFSSLKVFLPNLQEKLNFEELKCVTIHLGKIIHLFTNITATSPQRHQFRKIPTGWILRLVRIVLGYVRRNDYSQYHSTFCLEYLNMNIKLEIPGRGGEYFWCSATPKTCVINRGHQGCL